MASALGVKSKLRPQFIQTLVLDEEVSDRFMDELNRGLGRFRGLSKSF